MDFSKLKRDPEFVKKNWQKNGKLLVTKVPCAVVFPAHYLKGSLGTIGDDILVTGIFAVVMGDKYAVNVTLNMISFRPETTNIITINETQYIVLGFDTGSIVTPNTTVALNDKLIYSIYDEIIAKGKTPAYFSYMDLLNLFENVVEDSGVDLGANMAVMHIFTAIRSRIKGSRSRYYRETIKSVEQITNDDAVVVPFRSVSDSATNTLTKINGAYLNEGISSAALVQTTRVEPMEELLRS